MGKVKAILGEMSVEEFERLGKIVLEAPSETKDMTDEQLEAVVSIYNIWLENGGKEVAQTVLSSFGGSLFIYEIGAYYEKLYESHNKWLKELMGNE